MFAIEIPISVYPNKQPQWWKNFVYDNPKISCKQLKDNYNIKVGGSRSLHPYSLIFASHEEYIKFVIEWG